MLYRDLLEQIGTINNSLQFGKDGRFEPPNHAPWRMNLTALSQKWNVSHPIRQEGNLLVVC